MQDFYKYWPSLLILGAGVLSLIGTFIASKRASEKNDQIKEYGRLNKELGETNKDLGKKNQVIGNNIFELSQLHRTLSEETQKMVEANNKLAEQNLDLSVKNEVLAEKIVTLTELIRDLNTGGTSYPEVESVLVSSYFPGIQTPAGKLLVYITFQNNGDFAIDNLKIKTYDIGDYRNFDPGLLWMQLSTSGLNIHSRFNNFDTRDAGDILIPIIDKKIEVFKPAQQISLGPVVLEEAFEYSGFNIFIESKRQDWIILLRLYKPKYSVGGEIKAYRIMKVIGKGLEDLKINKDTRFPVSENGSVQWFKSDMPREWFNE